MQKRDFVLRYPDKTQTIFPVEQADFWKQWNYACKKAKDIVIADLKEKGLYNVMAFTERFVSRQDSPLIIEHDGTLNPWGGYLYTQTFQGEYYRYALCLLSDIQQLIEPDPRINSVTIGVKDPRPDSWYEITLEPVKPEDAQAPTFSESDFIDGEMVAIGADV
jgi:hypothetical protein